MKITTILLLSATFFIACSSYDNTDMASVAGKQTTDQVVIDAFQKIIDSTGVEGVILVYDPSIDTYYSNDFTRIEKGFLPASTFKIPNSIIALETGVVENDSTLFKWDGQKRALAIWDRDMILRDAFHFSCVPCYQEVARNIGAERMQAYLKQLDFGSMTLDSSNIDVFWLEGSSRISPRQELDFLTRLYYSKLPIAPRTEQIMKRMMVIEKNKDFKLSGKTGWAIRDGFNIGWFVAILETNEKTYFAVVNIEPKDEFEMELFGQVRKELAMEAFRILDIIKDGRK